jgi:uncharacterized protein
MTFVSRFVLIGLLLLATSLARAEVAVPELRARVTDLTQTLSSDQRQQLEQRLAALEQAKGSQLAILILPTTQPETIEQFSIRVVEQWKLGRKGVDDGVLLLVAKDDRAVRIEVGYGLEGAIPDAIANRVIDEFIIPAFKQGDFYGGLSQGVERLSGLIQGEPLPIPSAEDYEVPDDVFRFGILIFFILFFYTIGAILRKIFGRLLGALVAACIVGIPIGLMGDWIIGFAMGYFVFMMMIGGSGGAGRFGGGRGGSGGFRGGGGRFGGGGASGRW